jgi:hypothetical protein
VRGDSHADATFAEVHTHLRNRPVDFLLIDGDHRVRPGGVIAFHDIRPHSRADIKVDLLWHELRSRYRHEELIADANSHGYGIGLLYV